MVNLLHNGCERKLGLGRFTQGPFLGTLSLPNDYNANSIIIVTA